MTSEPPHSTEKLGQYIKSWNPLFGDDKRAVVCVPSVSKATELISLVEDLGNINLRDECFGMILIAAQLSKNHKKHPQFDVNSLAYLYSRVFLFWRQYVNETIKSLESYNELYEYHLKKNENLTFTDFFKKKLASAIEDMSYCFRFIHRLPPSTFSGIDVDDLAQFINHMQDVEACLTKSDIDDNSLNFVLGVSSSTKMMPLYYHEASGAAEDLLSGAKMVICTTSSCSQIDIILSQLNQSNAHAIDLVIVNDASMTSSSDIHTMQFHPEVRNTELSSEITSPSSMRIRHQFIKKYEFSKENKDLMDTEASFAPFKWIGIPEHLLAPVRNQGNTDTCTFHSTLAATETHYKLEAAADEPPRSFTIELCVEDMEKLC